MALRLLVLALVQGAGWTVWLDIGVRSQFEGKRWQVPARIYARPLELYRGLDLSPRDFVTELKAAGYQQVARVDRPGGYTRDADRFHVATRAFRFWDATEPAHDMRIAFSGDVVSSLSEDGKTLPIARLDPALIGRIFPEHRNDRILVRVRDVPPLLVKGLIAVEDRDFYHHHGISLRAIARALWADARAGEAVQGGSTLTQQLAKNFFLSPRRTLWRKVNEALIALLLEAHYSKREILQAYLNEVFLGQEGSRAIHGFGLASEFYFGRPVQELRLPEIALLVGLVRGASYYNPRRNPQRARERRDLVLDEMAGQGVITSWQAARAKRAPLGVLPEVPRGASPYPAFVEFVQRQLRRDYHERDLRSDGLRIFTTLSPRTQRAAQHALDTRLAALERGGHHQHLNGAVVVTDPQNGEVLALVGGRDARSRGFNRALDAVRQIGSLAKPAVYLTALEQASDYTLISRLQDEPIVVRGPHGKDWRPANFERRSHGPVPLYEALAHSYNQATVRLGMQVGVARVVRTFARLGIERELPAYPSLLLGAVALSPIEVAQMYQTIAGGGFRTPLRAIRSVTDAAGHPLSRYGLSVTQAFKPGPVFLLQRAMEEVLASGTARSAYRRLPRDLVLAGKTGTTDGLRDSWFAGFGADKLAVVWVGRDDDRPAGLTGATGALQVWTDLMEVLHPRSLRTRAPAGVNWYWTYPDSGYGTDPGCPGTERLPFLKASTLPFTACASAGVQPPRSAAESGRGAG